LVKVQALCKLAAEALYPQQEKDEGWSNEVDLLHREVLYMMPASTYSWYNDLKYYLTHERSPNHLNAERNEI
jgi:hypothetical protein